MVQINSIYQTPRDFSKSLYWSCNDEKTSYTEGPAERAAGEYPEQLQISSIFSYFIFRITAEYKFRRKISSGWMRMCPSSTVSCKSPISHLLSYPISSKFHSEPISCRTDKRAVLFTLWNWKVLLLAHLFYQTLLTSLPGHVFNNIIPLVFKW